MNRRQRARRHRQRRLHNLMASAPSLAQLKYQAVTAEAQERGKGETWVTLQMQQAGYLPDGKGGWRQMTQHEREMWL